ncbi:MAG: hypothetical protein HY290_07310 [Planctomycetia bacterium]|nr:hypothetical protein [Planctomycetia bacterium]
MNRLRITIAVLSLVAWAHAAQAEPLSTREFLEKLEGWRAADRDVSTLTLEVEGRVSLYSKDRFRLVKCPDVLFLSRTDLPEKSRKSLNVVAVGKLTHDPKSRDYTFRVSTVRVVPGELERFFEKRRQLSRASADEWYALGRWVALRGEFYADDKLLAHADEAYRHGLDIERKAKSKVDPEGLLELADKARGHSLPSLAYELTHEAFCLLSEQASKEPIKASSKLAERVAAELPGAKEPLTFIPKDLIDDYKRRPVPTYAAADGPTRRKLHRWLYVELQLRIIVPGLAPDGSNGFEIAEQIDRVVPEQQALAEEYRDRALKSRAAEVESLTRSQVIELYEQYRLRNQPRAADDLLESWLTMRKQGLEPDDTEGLLNLSEDYRQMLKRNDLADRLLIDGLAKNPKAADLIERLEKDGYRLFEGRWISDREFASRPEGKLELAIRNGLVERGMTASHVRRSRGKPDSQSRSATAGQVVELWSYNLADSSQIIVRFVKRAGQTELTVAEVIEGKGR